MNGRPKKRPVWGSTIKSAGSTGGSAAGYNTRRTVWGGQHGPLWVQASRVEPLVRRMRDASRTMSMQCDAPHPGPRLHATGGIGLPCVQRPARAAVRMAAQHAGGVQRCGRIRESALSVNDESIAKFVACGYEGERVTLELELKLLPNVSIVDALNAGKSTLLCALVAGRARSAVVAYTAFTALNPIIGVVCAPENGSLVGDGDVDGVFYDETVFEEWCEPEWELQVMASDMNVDMATRTHNNHEQLKTFSDSSSPSPIIWGSSKTPQIILGLGTRFCGPWSARWSWSTSWTFLALRPGMSSIHSRKSRKSTNMW
jgi:hypothetical protein